MSVTVILIWEVSGGKYGGANIPYFESPAVVVAARRRRRVARWRCSWTSRRQTSGTCCGGGRRRRSSGATTAVAARRNTVARRRSARRPACTSRDATGCRPRRSCHDDAGRCPTGLRTDSAKRMIYARIRD